MSEKEWDQITEVHLKGAFSCTKAAWPHFRKQKFGRVINTASAAGLYGATVFFIVGMRSILTRWRILVSR
jgi:NAD(P)-dependent dehydrogenase (short-subunit alcohol dehydrogenase family)